MKKKKIKRYKVNSKQSQCFAISVVDKPAVQSEFLVFSEQHPEKFVAQEADGKHMIYGCVLRADYPIYRQRDGIEYLLEFDAESIDKISKEYFKNAFQKKWTEAHGDSVEGLTITESWIKSSPTMDKSVALGLDPSIPCGSWFIGALCENEDIYQKCLNGTYHGFSAEALVSMEEFEAMIEEDNDILNNIEKMSFEELKDKIKDLVKEALAEQKPVEEEPVTEQVELEEEKPAEPVQEPVEAPKEPETTNTTPEEKEEPVEPENKPAEEHSVDSHLTELVESLKTEIEALKKMNGTLNDRVKELSKEPSTKPVSTAATAKKGSTYENWRETMRNLIH